VELQIHPHERGIGLQEGLDLVEHDIIVELSCLSDLPRLLVGGKLLPLDSMRMLYLLPEDLFFNAENEVL
jgi:hypothetical protein